LKNTCYYCQKLIKSQEILEQTTPIEIKSETIVINKSKLERIYNVNDFSGYTVYFSQNSFAKNIYPKEMDLSWNVKKGKASGSFDSKTASFNGKSIKDSFIKLKIDRLGNISKA
jgi:CRISPR-associated endonuclease Csn1